MNSLAINPGGSSANPYGSIQSGIVAALVRVLCGDPQSGAAGSDPTRTDAALARLGSILNQLLNPKNGAALMDINLDQLVNNSALQTLIRQLPPELLGKPQVFEALVLQNTLLPSTSTKESLPAQPLLILPQTLNKPNVPATTPALYRLTLQWQNRLLQILSPQPLANGSRLQLQSNARGEILLLATDAAINARGQNPAAEMGASATLPLQPQSQLQPSSPSQSQQLLQPLLSQQTLQPQLTRSAAPALQTPPPLQTLQQSARELLPRQQALHTLVPLLQKFLAPATRAQLPQPIVRAVMQLLQSLPRAEQLQNPTELREVIERSGSFFENRLAREQGNPGRTADAVPKLMTTDIKAQIATLLAAIRSAAPNALNMVRAQAQLQTDTDELVYSHKPGAATAAVQHPPSESVKDSADSPLSQLGKLLQSGLARIELNQVESATARHVGNNAQAPVPTWVVEVPLRTPFGADQLQLRIEQRRNKNQGRTRQQWNVDINLDLHAAGKLAATLTIVDKSVAATLWAEHEQTHRAVREEMDYLRAGLESVGVNVTEMQCRHGVPPVRSSALTQRLVDVHT